MEVHQDEHNYLILRSNPSNSTLVHSSHSLKIIGYIIIGAISCILLASLIGVGLNKFTFSDNSQFHTTPEKLDSALHNNIGNYISFSANMTLLPLSDLDEPLNSSISGINNLSFNGLNYDNDFSDETLSIPVFTESPTTIIGESLTLEGRIIKYANSIAIEATDVYTSDKTFETFLSERISDEFSLVGVVTRLDKSLPFSVREDDVTITPYEITFYNYDNNETETFYFKNGGKLDLIVNSKTKDAITNQYRKMEIGDTVTLEGSVIEIEKTYSFVTWSNVDGKIHPDN